MPTPKQYATLPRLRVNLGNPDEVFIYKNLCLEFATTMTLGVVIGGDVTPETMKLFHQLSGIAAAQWLEVEQSNELLRSIDPTRVMTAEEATEAQVFADAIAMWTAFEDIDVDADGFITFDDVDTWNTAQAVDDQLSLVQADGITAIENQADLVTTFDHWSMGDGKVNRNDLASWVWNGEGETGT